MYGGAVEHRSVECMYGEGLAVPCLEGPYVLKDCRWQFKNQPAVSVADLKAQSLVPKAGMATITTSPSSDSSLGVERECFLCSVCMYAVVFKRRKRSPDTGLSVLTLM